MGFNNLCFHHRLQHVQPDDSPCGYGSCIGDADCLDREHRTLLVPRS